jgi:hypothetical protein
MNKYRDHEAYFVECCVPFVLFVINYHVWEARLTLVY